MAPPCRAPAHCSASLPTVPPRAHCRSGSRGTDQPVGLDPILYEPTRPELAALSAGEAAQHGRRPATAPRDAAKYGGPDAPATFHQCEDGAVEPGKVRVKALDTANG